MDTEILQGFIEEAEGYLSTVRSRILLCTQEGKSIAELDDSIQIINTIKGIATLTGLKEISNCAEELELRMKDVANSKEKLTNTDSNLLLDEIAKLEAKISQLRFGVDEFDIDASYLVEKSFENFQSNPNNNEESEPEEIEVSEDSFEDFEIDNEMLEIFAMEAEDHLTNINENLELLEKNPNNREALLEIRRSSHTLKGSAGIVGLKTLSNLAHKVEDLLDYISDNEIESNVEIFHLLLSATDCISSVSNNELSEELTDRITYTEQKFDELLEMLRENENEAENKDLPIIKEETELEEIRQNENEVEIHDSNQPHSVSNSRSVIRVSLEKLDYLVKLVGEMVHSRSVFEQRISELEQQIDELQNTTRRLRHSTGKLESSFEQSMPHSGFFNLDSNNTSSLSSYGLLAKSEMLEKSGNLEFDTLEFDRYTEFNQTTRELIETTNDALSINSELDNLHSFLEMLFDSQKHLIDEMQDKLLSLRMVSFDTLSARLQRTVRVTADEEEKLVDLSIKGTKVEVDTQILDSLVEPLLHLLRNAVAHGIETPETRRLIGKSERGKISLSVYSEGTHIVLTITDDGRGISSSVLKKKAVELNLLTEQDSKTLTEEEALSLIFLPGLTTAEEISQISGRGVGMNIVKTNIERHKGTIFINSDLQKGTTFTLRLPMALAVTRSLLVKADNQTFAFPLKLVKHISEIAPQNLEKAKKDKKLSFGDITYNIVHLNELLGLPVKPKTTHQLTPLLFLETVNKPCALLVDKIIKPQEIVIKPLGKPLKDVQSLLGATLLGDGSVVPILDLVFLLDKKNPINQITMSKKEMNVKEKLSVMIVDDSPSVRYVNSTLVKNNNWEPVIAKDGLEALDILLSSNKLPDLILTDVEMPEMDGYELLASIKQNENLSKIPVVMITSRSSDKHRRKAYEYGVSDYLTKPYDDVKLVEIIKKLSSDSVSK